MDVNQAWIALFRRIPENLHSGLTVGLRSGSEIAIQTILKLEPEFIIMRGRLTGTQEGGKVLMMPYAEMTVLSILHAMKDTEVEAIFGKGAPPPVPIEMPAGVDEPPAPQARPLEAPSSDSGSGSGSGKKSEQPTKVAMLAKLRERLKEKPGKK